MRHTPPALDAMRGLALARPLAPCATAKAEGLLRRSPGGHVHAASPDALTATVTWPRR